MQDLRADIVGDDSPIEGYKADWDRLLASTAGTFLTFDEYRSSCSKSAMCLVVLREGTEVRTLAPFILRNGCKSFTLGERRLFQLAVRRLDLAGGSFIGAVSESDVAHIFGALTSRHDLDLVDFGEIELDGTLHKVLRNGLLGTSWRCVRASHKTSLHWLIDLPDTFDEYMAAFSGKKRQQLRRAVRKFDGDHNAYFKVVSRVEEVNEFLKVGERISRLTYQWNVGQKLIEDEPTRRTYTIAAEEGHLRCYLLFAGDTPCAFMRGNIRNGKYDFQTPGFDPAYKRSSPGTVLLLRAIEDLISNTDCAVFDFGEGGDMSGFKSTFGNRSYEVISLEAGPRWRLYSMFLFAIQDGLNMMKRLGNAILSDELKRAIKRQIRAYGSS